MENAVNLFISDNNVMLHLPIFKLFFRICQGQRKPAN